MEIRNLVKKIIGRREPEIIVLVSTAIIFNTISNIPYLNLFFTPVSLFVLLWIEAIYLFKIESKVSLIVGIASFFMTFPFLIINSQKISSSFADASFLLMLIGAMGVLIKKVKTK